MKNNKNWMKNAIIYQILIDRFAGYDPHKDWNQNQFIGGNIKGIIDTLPYLKNLGVNTLWISPFYETSAYHGYHVTNFFDVEPQFGSKLDLQRLIDLAHQNDLKIIADFVPNHVSRHHPFFLEALHDKKSEYVNWFYFSKWPDKYQCFLSVRELPKLNLNNDDTRKHVINAAKYWLSLGLDGYRLDHVIGPSNNFWRSFYSEVKKQYPNTVLIGEAWMQGISWSELKTIQIPWKRMKWIRKRSHDSVLHNYVELLDGVLDFTAQQYFREYVWHHQSSAHLKKMLSVHYSRFPSNFLLPAFLDNHDMDRFLFQCNNNTQLLKKVATIQFSLPQPIIIYYGTEQGLTQHRSIWNIPTHGDLLARAPMPWNKKDQNIELFNFYRKLISNRTKR